MWYKSQVMGSTSGVHSKPVAGTTSTSSGPKKTGGAKKKKKASPKKKPKKKTTTAAAKDHVTTTSTKPSDKIAPPPTTPSSPDGLGVPASFPLSDLKKISTTSPAGVVFRLDGGSLDSLRLQTRRIKTQDGKLGYHIELKLAGPARQQFEDRMTKQGAKQEPMRFFRAEPGKSAGKTVLAETGKTQLVELDDYATNVAPGTKQKGKMKALHLEGKGWAIDYVPENGPVAYRGAVRIRLTGTDPACTKALGAAVKKLGLGGVFAPTTPTALRRYAMMRLLWRVDGDAARALAKKGKLDDLKLPALEKALAKAGVDKKRIDALRYEEVAPGHFTVVDEQLAAEMTKAGLCYAYSTCSKPEHVLSILQNGQKATVSRWSEGMFIEGMSSLEDMSSGGAQGVFSRLVTKKAKSSYWNGRTYKIILKPDLLARTDIWGHSGDQFGKSWNLGSTNFGAGLIKAIDSGSFSSSNEIISPFGNGPQYIACVVTDQQHAAKKLRDLLKSKGFKPPGGQTIEQFVKVVPNIKPDLLS